MINDEYNKKKLAASITLFLLVAGIALLAYSSFKKEPVTQLLPPLPSLPALQSLRTEADTVYPSQTLDLSNWKLTLPVTTPGDSSVLLEIRQTDLNKYQMRPWFMLTSDKAGVVFRAPVNAPTTANSNYPRSELREMTDNGTKNAYWPSTKGTHTLFLDEAITAVPQGKSEVVAGQIHGDDDDLIVIRLEYPELFVARGKSNLSTLDKNYALGKRFTIKFVAENGKIMVYYNNGDAPVYTLEKKVNQAYFKVGAYTQSNCETEGSPDLCTADNYGEVVIYKAVITHK